MITPDILSDHGITSDEYKLMCELMGREPNLTELGIFSVMWSEHCSYKSSRVHLRGLPTKGPQVLQGPGENAGVVDIGDGLAVCFKMESHNHPSYIEPYQGAATGVGGILRDIFTMGARPIANLNSLRFGDPKHAKTPHLVRGVVAGIGGYGNTMGIPTVAGEVFFDECYNGNILVNAMTIGLMRADRIFRGNASGVGNPVIYFGAKTGRDGIHGATMASGEFDENSAEQRPTVQVGDPFTEKLLMEACLELMNTDVIVGIQDMGAAGLTCSSFEMASRAGSGMILDLDRVPVREQGMTPYEMMLSESQERMLVVVNKGSEEVAQRIFEKWDLDWAIVGQVTDDGHVTVKFHNETVAHIPVRAVTDDAPVYERPVQQPSWLAERQHLDVHALPLPTDYNDVLLRLIASPNLCNRAWVWEQYDHMVLTNSVVRPGSDAAVVRIKGTDRAIAATSDCNSRYCFLDPYTGAALAVAEAARNLSCSGATPLAVTDCLNFGNPEKPEIMWQFAQAVRGMGEACKRLETPIIGGNVSLYNETQGNAIYPTPTIGMVGLLEHVDLHCTQWWRDAGDKIILLGQNELDLGGSEYLKTIHNMVAGTPPTLDLDREIAVQKTCRAAIRRRVVKSAHDVSDGGLAVALFECCVTRPTGLLGAVVELQDDLRTDALLFGESASRILLSVSPEHVETVLTIAREHGAKAHVIGTVGGGRLRINQDIDVELSEAAEAWRGAFEKLVN